MSANTAALEAELGMTEEKPGIGHNSGDKPVEANATGERLKSFIERVERLEEEKKALADDIREVYAEAKAVGFEPKIMRKLIAIRKMEADRRREEQELTDLYMHALGMID